MSITVTCTFLKSNRFLLVGVLLFCGIGAARLTQRLSQPSAADSPDNSLDSAASRAQSLLVLQLPSLPRSRGSLSRPPPTLSPRYGITRNGNISQPWSREPPPDTTQGGFTEWPRAPALCSLFHGLSSLIITSSALQFFFLLTSQG